MLRYLHACFEVDVKGEVEQSSKELYHNFITILTFTSLIPRRHISLYSLERLVCALDVLFVRVPGRCFLGEACVVDVLV